MNKQAKVSIIGGAGFLGTRLSSVFENHELQHDIYDINSNGKSNIKIADIEDLASLKMSSETEAIINLAAVHRDDIKPISRYDDVNVQGSVNVCEAARIHNINKIIFTSSVAIYGFAEPDTDESGKPNYFNDYGRTKFLAENVYRDWYEEDPENRTLIIIRPTVIFGEGNRGNVYNLLKQIASNRFLMFGKGENKKSMAYVENVATFIHHCLALDKGVHLYNYVDKPDFNMNSLVSYTREILFNKKNPGIRFPAFLAIFIGKLADLVSLITNKSLPISSIRVKKFMGTTQFYSSVHKTGFIAPISLEEGLKRTLKYEFLEDNSDKPIYETE